MFEAIATFWAAMVILFVLWSFAWLTWHLPECIRLVWHGIDDTAMVGIILWVGYAAIVSLGVGYVWDLIV